MSTPSAIESVLVENRVFEPSEATVKLLAFPAWMATTPSARKPLPTLKVSGPAWRVKNVVWSKPFTKTLDESNAPFYKWFEDGELNASANCL